jgi:hypothetical protein
MFGHDWESAEATIIAERLLTNWSRGTGDATVPHEYVADVSPQGEAPFRATFHEPLMHGHSEHPRPGEVVNVLFDRRVTTLSSPASTRLPLARLNTRGHRASRRSPMPLPGRTPRHIRRAKLAPPGSSSRPPHPARRTADFRRRRVRRRLSVRCPRIRRGLSAGSVGRGGGPGRLRGFRRSCRGIVVCPRCFGVHVGVHRTLGCGLKRRA